MSFENTLLNEITLALDKGNDLHAPTKIQAKTCVEYSNSCKCGYQQCCCVVDDPKEDHKPVKVAINCPKCTIKLGFRVVPSHQNLKGSANIAPGDDGSGDNEDTLGSMSLKNKGAVRKAQNMSYTVLKESVSLPDTKTIDATNDRRKVRSRGSNPDVEKIPLKTGKTYDCLQTSQGDEICTHPVPSKSFNIPCTPPTVLTTSNSSIPNNGINAERSSHSHHRHCSFADPIVSNIDDYYNSIKSPELNDVQDEISHPFLQVSNGRSLRFVDNSEHLFERDYLLGLGIDLEDGVPLYESSSASSFGDPENKAQTEEDHLQNDEKVKSAVSHNTPVESKVSGCGSGLLAGNAQANHDGCQTTGVGDHLSPEEIDALESEIPEYRQDLYKDCFTLFVEQWFGKRGN